MWQFAEAVRGLADGCLHARHPGHRRQRQLLQPDRRRPPILPTPVIGVLGVIDDVDPAHAARASQPTATLVYLLGDTRDEFGGSEWAHVVHGHLGGRPPPVDLARERLLAEVLIDALARRADRLGARPVRRRPGAGAGRVRACAATSARASSLPEDADPFVALFSESTARASSPCRAARRSVHRHVHGARAAARADRRRSTCSATELDVQGQFSDPAARAARRPGRRTLPGAVRLARWPERRRPRSAVRRAYRRAGRPCSPTGSTQLPPTAFAAAVGAAGLGRARRCSATSSRMPHRA